MLIRQNLENHIVVSHQITDELSRLLQNVSPDKIFVLVDENSLEYCFPHIKDAFTEKVHIIKIRSGESEKNIKTLHLIWDAMFAQQADRKSVLINLGGGVITDMGGFAASTFKRGIDFINIPTTLLAQVDAAIGGKTGVNYGKLKNQIGLIKLPKKVLVSSVFLDTLPKRQLLNGFAEMLKHGFISNKEHLNKLWNAAEKIAETSHTNNLLPLIKQSMDVKVKFVEEDFTEEGPRKALNFGHTFGHAFESLKKGTDKELLHGEAVAHGMICELFLSNKILKYDLKNFLHQTKQITSIYQKPDIKNSDIEIILEYMKHDKKNNSKSINFTLLQDVGQVVTNCTADESDIREALYFYTQLSK